MNEDSKTNHGEGNPAAADRFNKAEQAFVDSPRGKKKIQEGPRVRPDEEADLAKAEQVGKDHAAADDSKAGPRSGR